MGRGRGAGKTCSRARTVTCAAREVAQERLLELIEENRVGTHTVDQLLELALEVWALVADDDVDCSGGDVGTVMEGEAS